MYKLLAEKEQILQALEANIIHFAALEEHNYDQRSKTSKLLKHYFQTAYKTYFKSTTFNFIVIQTN